MALPSFSFDNKEGIFTQTLVFVLAGLLIIGSSFILWNSYKETSTSYNQSALEEIIQYADSVAKYRNFYTAEILPKAKEYGLQITHDYKNIEGALPLPATFAKDFGQYLADGSADKEVNLYSRYPFPWRKDDPLDSFQLWALDELQKNPSKKVWRIENKNGVQMLRYAVGDVMKDGCVDCHNSYPGTPKNDWKTGDVRGALEVSRPLATFGTQAQKKLKESFIIMIGVLVAMTMLFIILFRRLRAAIEAAKKVNEELVGEIEQREKMTSALERSELKTRTIVNSVQEVIIVIDNRGRITEINDAVQNVFGYQNDQLTGLNINTLMTEEHSRTHDGYIKTYMRTGTKNIMKRPRELFARRRNGDTFPIELTVNEARINDEVFFVGTIRDITHRRKADQQIAEAHHAAVESAQLKSEFLANMSHEIRTPMNGVIGMTEMLMQSELDREQQNLTKIVKDSAESLLVIINDILDFSKIEAGKLTVRSETFKPIYTLESVFELLSEEASRKFVKLALFVDKDVPQNITCDSGRLRQILINLLSNALKFTEQGHVLLMLSRQDKDFIKFEITDTGSGIPDEAQKTLFDAFSQVDGSYSREHGGTGLGLAICRQLVELMGGEIGVSSSIGHGSKFWFTLPAEQEEKTEAYIAADISVMMFCNDHLLTRHHHRQMEQWGMRPDIVNDINHLFSKLGEQQYDLIAFDADSIFHKPDHALGIHSLIKELRSTTDAPIVLFASHNQYTNLENLELGHGIELMQKPIKHTAVRYLLTQMRFTKSKKQSSSKKMLSAPNKKPKKKKMPQQPANGLNVLLAEDNRVNQKVACFMIGKLGYEVDIAVNGKEVLSKLEDDKYDLIFMDCQMPEMDGYQATREIRALDDAHHSKKIPIVALTAHAMKSNDEECYAAGMDDYLTKPVRAEELSGVLEKWMPQMKAMQEARKDRKNETKESEAKETEVKAANVAEAEKEVEEV